MRLARPQLSAALIGAALALLSGTPALADDSEVFTSTTFLNANKVRPNILFIIDTSGSMDTAEPNYDPTQTYAGPCGSDRIYWRTGNQATPPACDTTTQWVSTTANRCKASESKLDTVGVYVDTFAQFDGTTTWGALTAGQSSRKLECVTDDKVHGDTDGSSQKRAANVSGGWETNDKASIDWGGRGRYTLYTSNYANWYYGPDTGSRLTRLDIVRNAAKTITDDLQGVNLGVMRYDPNAEGGMVTQPVAELTPTHRTDIKASLDSFTAKGFTPLSETLYEAGLYFAGMNVDYGLNSTPPSVASSRDGDTYKSPVEFSCQKNYIVYLTDGLPTRDQSADKKIAAFDPPGLASPVGTQASQENDFKTVLGRNSCTATPNPDAAEQGNGECLDDMAEYLNKADLRGDLYGVQNVTTFMIGFGDDLTMSEGYLDNVAKLGGSEHSYTATNSASLATTLEDIFAKVENDANLTFTSPTVSVNAFNRAQNLNDLYVSVFSPSDQLHWPGNLKKYRIVGSEIQSQDPSDASKSVQAVDPATGFFLAGSQSYWSTSPDGPEVELGGAAHKLPDYAESGTNVRTLFTYLGNSNLTDSSNDIKNGNSKLTDAMLGLADGDALRPTIVAFARGQDVNDLTGDGSTTDNNFQMGDPMHASPAVVIYGGSKGTPDVNDGVVYVPTNDGYLHAIDTKTGVEKWAFVPPEFLTRLKARYDNPAIAGVRSYALDGNVRVFKYDANNDGIVTPSEGDFVYIYFGFARGGAEYYALDVTNPDAPQFKWHKTQADLPGLGQAWSTPAITRVDVGGAAQNDGKFVLIFGGGYDADGQESYVYSPDTVGNRIFMLDAVSGALLWSAGPQSSSADLKLTHMTNSIPGGITVLDTDGDGLADRMYAGDMGGRVWRFDIFNQSAPTALVTGGVFASLGSGDQSTVVRADSRRFYYAPDVALMSARGARPYYNIAIGSGYRGHPLEQDTHDRFYSLRDYLPFGKRDQSAADGFTAITDSDTDLVNVTNSVDVLVPEGSNGWKLELRTGGEKVLAESVTVNGIILFPTFQPRGQDTTNPCLPATLNRVYAVRADTARPFTDNNKNGKADTSDRSTDLKQGGIAAEISVLVNNGTNGTGDGTNGGNGKTGNTTCLSGVEILKQCVPVGGTVRTFWQRN